MFDLEGEYEPEEGFDQDEYLMMQEFIGILQSKAKTKAPKKARSKSFFKSNKKST